MLVVGQGNSIHFRELNEQLASYDNTFLVDEEFWNTPIFKQYRQPILSGDTLVIQCKVASGDTPACTFYDVTNGLSGAVSGSLKSSYTLYDFWEFTKTFGDSDVGNCLYFKITNTPVTGTDKPWQSEPIHIYKTLENSYLLEWSNYDSTTGRANNNFSMDYSTDIVPFMRVQGIFKEYAPASEISVYQNLDETTKLKEKLRRTLKLVSDAVPRYIAEKLTAASAHDKFYVNEVAFIREEEPELTPADNRTEWAAVLTQATVTGLNSDDVGPTCDDMSNCKLETLEENGVTAPTTFVIPEGYLLHSITVTHNNGGGSYSDLKIGRGVGDDDIGAMHVEPNAVGVYQNPKTLVKNIVYAPDGGGDETLYVDVTGSTPDVDIKITLFNIT